MTSLHGLSEMPRSRKKIETEKVLHYKYDTGDYTNHNKLIPMQFSVSTIAPERLIFAEKRCRDQRC
jgi:hypothetical protein